MADTKFSQFTADTDQLPETLELVGYAGGSNYRVLLPDLRKSARAIQDQKSGQGYFLLSAEGQSWLKGGGSVSATTMAANSNVYSWQPQGTSPETYEWEAVDPTASTVSATSVNPSTGLTLGNTGDIMWYLADLLQKATNWPVYIVNTAYSDGDIERWALIGSQGSAAAQHATQIAAATADSAFPGSSGAKPDLRVWAQGWTSAGTKTAGEYAETALAHMIDTEDSRALGWADPNSPLYVLGFPRNAQQEAGKSTWLGVQLFCELAGNNVHYVETSLFDEFDGVHQAGDSANYTGEDIFSQELGLSGPGVPDGAVIYERATATLAEGYTKTTHSASAPTLSTGELNFDTDFSTSPMSVTKLRLHYESGDGNNIPWRNLDPDDVLRMEDASSPQNYIEVLLSGRAQWSDTYPNTPNHAEFPISGIVKQNGWPVADGTTVTVSVRKATLTSGVTAAKDYYTGEEGKARIPHNLQLDKYEDSSFSEYFPTTYISDSASRVARAPMAGGVTRPSDTIHRRFEVETTNGTPLAITNVQLPDDTRFAYTAYIDGYRSDALATSPLELATYTGVFHGSLVRVDSSVNFAGSALTLGESSSDPNSPQVSATCSPFFGALFIQVTGQTSETWQWTIELDICPMKA